MISTNKTSEILSIGSIMRVGRSVRDSNIVVVKRLLLLPAASQRVIELNQ